MKIDFNSIETKELKNFKNGLGSMITNMFSDESIKIMKSTLKPGCSVGKHTHVGNSEIIYVLSGSLKAIINDEVEIINEGEVHYCKENETHELMPNGDNDVTFFAIVPTLNK